MVLFFVSGTGETASIPSLQDQTSSIIPKHSTTLSSDQTSSSLTWLAWAYESQLTITCSNLAVKPVIHQFSTPILAIEYIPEQKNIIIIDPSTTTNSSSSSSASTTTTANPTTCTATVPSAIVVVTNDKQLSVIIPKISNPSSHTPTVEYTIAYKTILPRRAHTFSLAYLPSSSSSSSSSSLPVLIIGDKIGDAYAIPYPDVSTNRRFLLSHTGSIFTCITRGLGQFCNTLITADRDEKIRVSRWPTTFIIDSFCLGHTRYISFLHVNETIDLVSSTNSITGKNTWNYQSTDILLTGSGDGSIRVWFYKTGTLLHTLYLGNTALELIQNNLNGNNGKVLSSVSPYAWCSNDAHADGLMIQSANEDDTTTTTDEKNNNKNNNNNAPTTTTSGTTDQGKMETEVDEEDEEVEANDNNATTVTTTTESNHLLPTIPDTAVGYTIQPVQPAVTPLRIMEIKTGHNSSLVAVVVEGEAYVRILRLYTNSAVMIPVDPNQVQASNGTVPVTLPQVRIEQIGHITLPNDTIVHGLTKIAYTNDHDILAVCTSYISANNTASFTILTYRINYTNSSSPTSIDIVPITDASEQKTIVPGIKEWNHYFTTTDEKNLQNINPTAIHGSIMTANPEDYDKRGIAVL